MSTALSVMLAGLELDTADQVLAELRRAGFSPNTVIASNHEEFLSALDAPPRLIISADLAQTFGASEALDILRDGNLSIPLIVVSGQPEVGDAVSYLRQGAWDYLGLDQLSRMGDSVSRLMKNGFGRVGLLDASEERYRSLVESMNEGLLAADRDAKITFVNPAICRLLNYNSEEILGRYTWDLFAPADVEMIRAQLANRRRGESSTYNANLLTSHGDEVRVQISAVPLYDKQDNFVGSNAIISDLTELRLAEDSLRKAAEEWRHSFDSIDEMILINDADYNIRRCNRTLADQVGLPIRQVLGKTCYKLVHGMDEPPAYCPHQQVLASGEPGECEVFEKHLGRSVHISIAPIKEQDGTVTGTVHIIRDVTDKRSQEQETLRLTQALVESFQATTLALTSMVESRDPYTSRHTQGVAELCQRVGRAMEMSEDDIQGLSACALLHDIGKGAIPLDILNKPGGLTFHEMGIIREHPATAYHILQTISFPWPVAEVVWQHHERLDGSGYPRKLKHDAIHPWASVLAVCDVVEAMTSHRPYRPAHTMRDAFNVLKEGAGSKFDVKVVAAVIRTLGMDDRRMMVVDDDPGVLNVLTTYLEREGLHVEGFSDPAQAVDAFNDNPTPVVLTDLKMPGISGLDVLRSVKERSPESEVIVITGHGDKASVVAAMRMGASDFLEKPVKLTELANSVTRARHRYTGETKTGTPAKNGLSLLLDR
jgi:PAS domain S-box-containing protein